MHDLLLHILDFNKGLTSGEMVVIANIKESLVDGIRAIPRLKDLKFIIGDHFQDATLRRGAPERAKKILLLADRSPTAEGYIPNRTEADARTIMAAICLSNIAGNTLVAAEILDPKLDHYLKLAGVSEIIYSREYSRLLLGNAAGGTGVSNVIFDLLTPHSRSHIETIPIPEVFVGQTYAELRREYERKDPRRLLLGILEHTGNPMSIKKAALKEAQKTPNIEKLITNLQQVKHLRCNNPVLNPPPSFVLSAGCASIVIVSDYDEEETFIDNDASDAKAAA